MRHINKLMGIILLSLSFNSLQAQELDVITK